MRKRKKRSRKEKKNEEKRRRERNNHEQKKKENKQNELNDFFFEMLKLSNIAIFNILYSPKRLGPYIQDLGQSFFYRYGPPAREITSIS